MDINELHKLTSKFDILYVEDDLEVQNNTKMIFEDMFDNVEVANDGAEGLEKYKIGSYDIVITDVNMPHMNGIELIQEIHKINPTQIIIIISAHNETEYFIDGIQSGIDGYILKPIDYNQLFITLEKISLIIQNRKENLEYKNHMESLIEEKTKDLEKNYKKMQELLTTDKVTGMPNANILYQYLDYQEGEKDKKLTLYLMHLDNFNYMVQSYSKEICNEVLKQSANFIVANIAPDGKLYKLTEDEFVIVFEIDDKEYSIDLITQINAFFKETPVAVSNDNKEIYVTFSTGIVIDSAESNILQKARATLNEIQNHNMFGHFRHFQQDSTYIKELQNENKWFEKIREIIEEDHLVPYFHPIVSNQNGEIVRYECLIRAEDDGKIISPMSFLEAVKKAGLIGSLTRVMINKCFKLFSESNLHFSINITNQDILDDKFVDFVLAKKTQYNLKPEYVTFEILEDIILDEKCEVAYDNLKRLQENGFLLAIDDFGDDRSNFSRFVSKINFDYIKIDGQFVKNIDTNEQNYKIVSSIVHLAKEMNMQVVAEYVSTKEEYEVIKELGIDFSQGYFFHKPLKDIKI